MPTENYIPIEYRYDVLEQVLKDIAVDYSYQNIKHQIGRLTSDEKRKLRELMFSVEEELNAA